RETITSPRTPCARSSRPTCSRSGKEAPRSVEELDLDVRAVAAGGRPHDRADGVGHPSPLADDPTHVAGAHAHVEAGAALALLGGYLDGVAVVDELLEEVAQHRV